MAVIAIALFGEEISPRMDCCGALAFLDSEQEFKNAEVVRFLNPDGERRLGIMLEHHAKVLLCGGIRRYDWFRLQAQGIQVFSGLTGPASKCYMDYQEGRLSAEAFANTPSFGCQRRQRRHGKGA